MKTALDSSILMMFESLGLTVEQIAQQQELEPVIVKASLVQHSSVYRQLNGLQSEESEESLVSKEEMMEFLGAYKQLARYTEDDHLKERCLRNLINAGKKVTDGIGENDMHKVLREVGSTGNIVVLNNIIQSAKAAKAKVVENVNNILELENVK